LVFALSDVDFAATWRVISMGMRRGGENADCGGNTGYNAFHGRFSLRQEVGNGPEVLVRSEIVERVRLDLLRLANLLLVRANRDGETETGRVTRVTAPPTPAG
jgi:hypothetical protein